MTILPAKKKREKEPRPPSSASNAGPSDPNRQQPDRPMPSSSGAGSSAPKRSRFSEDARPPPIRRHYALLPPSPRPSNQPSTSAAAAAENSAPAVIPARAEPREGGNNSDDEYQEREVGEDAHQREADFIALLARRGLIIREMAGDGACMFRAIAEQIYGDQEMHGQIRELCMNYMANNRDHFRHFITEDYETYIARKRDDTCQGNHLELQAMSELFARPVEVYQYSDVPINVLAPRDDPTAPPNPDGTIPGPSNRPPVDAAQYNQNPPLRLSYHNGVHYNAIIAPNVATVGVGLGLPGMEPGSADRDLLAKAMSASELEQIEATMLQDKINMTDFQRTQSDIDDQIIRESLLSFLKDLKKNEGPSTSAETSSGAELPSSSSDVTSSAATSSEAVPSGAAEAEPRQRLTLYEEMLAAQSMGWNPETEDVELAEVLLLSQHESFRRPAPRRDDDPNAPSSSGTQ